MSVTRRIAGRYRLVEKVGTGGMGVLWAAFDDRSEQSVAVRILQRGVDEPGRVAHFRASARAAARLAHPAVARVLDEGHDPDVGPFIVSEWIDGWPLTAWRGLTPPWAFTRAILIQLCDALSHIHARGLVHLDLRPGNLMVTAGEHGPVLRVVDVGCARIDDGWSDHSVGAQATLKLLGSLKYMAPEVGDAPPWLHGAWSDLYSVGLVGWELLTGKLPHDELQGVALLMRRASEPAPLLPAGFGGESNNTALRTLMQRLLATNPAERPLSAAQVRKTLEALPPGPNEWRWLDPPRGPKVRQAPFDAARARAGAFPLWPLQPGPVVGRDAELARVTEALHQTVAGYGARLIVLEGIVGAGKSRLAQEATQEAEERGFLRAWRVHFTAGGAPGSGLTGALEDLLRAAGTDADGVARRVAALPLLLGVDPTGLEAALPALLRPDPTPFARPGNEADPGAEVGNVGSAHMVAGAFLELLRRASANETIALWLDDLHLATPAEGLDLVQRVLAEPSLNVVLVATVATGHPATLALAAAVGADPRVTWHELGPLGEADVHDYVVARLGLPDPDHSRVREAMAGRPLHMRLLADHLLDGRLIWLDGFVRVVPGTVLPFEPQEIFAAQFERLGGSGNEALVPDVVQGLAHARLPITPRVVSALTSADPHRPWERALAGAERARFLWRGPGGRWLFTGSSLRDWLVQRGHERAQSWHRRWLKALVHLEDGGRGRLGIERAAHAEALGDSAAALSALTEAAAWALGPGQQALERSLLAATQAERLAESVGETLSRARALRLKAELLRQGGLPDAARASLIQARAVLAACPDPIEQGWCHLADGWLALDARDLQGAEAEFQSAVDCFETAGDAGGVHWGNLGLAYVAVAGGAHAVARTLARACEEGFGILNAARGVLAARLLRARAADAAGDPTTAEERYLRLQEMADARRWMLESTTLRLHRARIALQAGRPRDAVRLLDEARALAEPLRLFRLREWVDAVRPAALAAAGEHSSARHAIRRAVVPNPRLRTSAALAIRAALARPAVPVDPAVAAALERFCARLEAEGVSP